MKFKGNLMLPYEPDLIHDPMEAHQHYRMETTEVILGAFANLVAQSQPLLGEQLNALQTNWMEANQRSLDMALATYFEREEGRTAYKTLSLVSVLAEKASMADDVNLSLRRVLNNTQGHMPLRFMTSAAIKDLYVTESMDIEQFWDLWENKELTSGIYPISVLQLLSNSPVAATLVLTDENHTHHLFVDVFSGKWAWCATITAYEEGAVPYPRPLIHGLSQYAPVEYLDRWIGDLIQTWPKTIAAFYKPSKKKTTLAATIKSLLSKVSGMVEANRLVLQPEKTIVWPLYDDCNYRMHVSMTPGKRKLAIHGRVANANLLDATMFLLDLDNAKTVTVGALTSNRTVNETQHDLDDLPMDVQHMLSKALTAIVETTPITPHPSIFH